jgi:Spy/CpxP family protein refolding chaperone
VKTLLLFGLGILAVGQPIPRAGRGPETAILQMQGRWWTSPEMLKRLGVSPEQAIKLDDIVRHSRVKLIDANAALDKAEAVLDLLVNTDHPDDTKVLAQLDQVAQARAELEKVNGHMLWTLRRVLTPEQWRQLHFEPAAPPPPAAPRPPRQP